MTEFTALKTLLQTVQRQLDAAQGQIHWFTRQLFGSQSDRQLEIDHAVQPSLFTGLIDEAPQPIRCVQISIEFGNNVSE